MTKKGHTEEQTIAALQQAEAGGRPRRSAASWESVQATFYNWRKQYAGLGVQELWELRQLREENSRLKRMVADLSLDRQILFRIPGSCSLHLERSGTTDWQRCTS
jgi:putative transposase